MKDLGKLTSASIGIALAAFAFIIFHLGLLDSVELKTLDFRFRVRGPRLPQAPIVIVNIDQDSFDELHLPWPWPRDLHAELIRKLARGGAKVIGFDILFLEPKPDAREDRELALAIKEAGNVILGAELTEELSSDFGPKRTMNLPIPLLRDDALGYGLVNLIRSPDAVVRSAMVSTRFQEREYLALAPRIYQALRQSAPEIKPSGEPYWIDFHGPARTYPTVPYYRVLKGEIDPEFFRDKIVLVGAFAESLHDVFPTPFSASQPTAGVEIQANFLDTLLAGKPLTKLPEPIHLALFGLMSALAILSSMQLSPIKAFALILFCGAAFMLGCVYLFASQRLWLPMTPSLLGLLTTYGGLTVFSYVKEQRERLRYRAQFMKYVSPDVVAEILEDREGLALGGKRRHITVLFSDVRGFTGISEKISPEEVVSFLGQYFAEVTQIVFKHGGTVDKFMGDGMMAFFGAPKSHPDDAVRAVKTGLEMIDLVQQRSAEWAKLLGQNVAIGVGINSGDAVVGSIGSELRADYTAIGDTVNLASRLEGLTKELGVPILISETTVADLSGAVDLVPLQRVKVVGRETALLVYTAAAHSNAEVNANEAAEPYVQRKK